MRTVSCCFALLHNVACTETCNGHLTCLGSLHPCMWAQEEARSHLRAVRVLASIVERLPGCFSCGTHCCGWLGLEIGPQQAQRWLQLTALNVLPQLLCGPA